MVQQSPLEARVTLPTSLDTTGPGRQCIPQTPRISGEAVGATASALLTCHPAWSADRSQSQRSRMHTLRP